MYRLEQFGLVEEYFSPAIDVEVLRARYDAILKRLDVGDPADAETLDTCAREVGVNDAEVAHFFEHWISGASGTWFPHLDASDVRRELVMGAVTAIRTARALDLPISLILLPTGRGGAFRAHPVITGSAVVLLIHAPLEDDIVRAK